MIIQWMIHQDIDARDTLVFPDITPVLFDKDLFPGKSDKIKRTQYRFLWHGKPADAIYRIYQIIVIHKIGVMPHLLKRFC